VGDLTPGQCAELMRRLDDACRQAQDLAKSIREKMSENARADTPNLQGQPKPRVKTGERR
jgi:hypothetical protein